MTVRSVGIFGLGLMGGSLARDLADRGVRVAAHDRRPDAVDAAIADGTVRSRLDPAAATLEPADLYVLAVPVDVSLDLLRDLARRLPPESLVTDLGSTKAPICRLASELGLADRFAGSHPFTGDHRSGWEAARPGLYRDAAVYLCPADGSTGDVVRWLEAFWRDLGAVPHPVPADVHDRRMAWVSHLPQILASTLARCIATTGYDPVDLGPGGRDMTRLAGSSPEMWTAICLSNAPELARAVQEVRQDLASFHHALETADSDALLRFFRDARHWLA